MRTYKTIRKECESEVIDLVRCDICGKKIDGSHLDGSNYHNSDSIVIKRVIGVVYPGDDCRSVKFIDMCYECWEGPFSMWLKDNYGKEFNDVDYNDYQDIYV